jgi:mitogen-activated protein kinase kinase kinase
VNGKIIQWVQGKIIGQGITGEVYEAMNINTAEMFVVKKIQLVHPFQGLDQTKVKALKQEIDRYKLLDYQHIITYYGGELNENNVFCIYLEYMSGGSIADLCKRYGRLGETICRKYII